MSSPHRNNEEAPLRTIVFEGFFGSYKELKELDSDDAATIEAPLGFIMVMGSNTVHNAPEFLSSEDAPYRLFGRTILDC